MGKITPRFFLAVFIFGLCLLSANIVLANINYGPEKPMSGKEIEEISYFVGFLLEEAPTIIAPEDKTENNDPGECYASSLNLGTATIEGTNNSPELSVNGNNIDPSNYEFQVGVTTVIWTITNGDGTDSDTQTVRINDTTDPTASNPAPISVQCEADVPAANISVVTDEDDNCTSNPTVAFVSDSSDGNSNPEVITRIYSVTDEAGNSINVTQEIKVDDTIDPTASNPAPISVPCSADIPATDIAVVTDEADNCNSNPTVAFVSDSSDGNSNPEVITRTYSVTDVAGNSINVTQEIKVDDTIDPTASNPAPISVQCSADIPATDIAVVTDEADNCTSNPTVAFVSDSSDGNSNPEVITRTYSVTDEAGNSINVFQEITVNDTTDPTVSNPAPISVQCSADIPATDIAVVTDEADNCTSNPTVAFVSDSSDGNSNPEVITRTYSVTDEAGNSINVFQEITVNDTTDPTASNPTPVSVQCSADIPAADITVVTDEADNCTANPIVAFVSDSSDGNFNPEVITRIYSVTDKAGNEAFVEHILTIEDTQAPILPTVSNITWGCEYTAEAPIAQDNCDGEIIGEPNPSTTFTETGSITWTFTDSSGNSSSLEQTITIKPLIAEIETTNINCYGFENGYAQVTASGGLGNLIYDWGSLSGSGNSQQNLAPGDYLVTVSDQNGCSVELPFTITQPDDLEMTTSPTSTPGSCFGGNDGSITAGTISGGTPDQNGNYQYSIDNETWNITGEFTNVEAGTHTIFVLDSNNCALQVTVNVEEPDVLNATLNKTDVSCFEGNDGSISLTNLSGGSGTYEFSVNGNTWTSATQAIEGLSAGNYEVQIRDTNAPDCKIVLNDAYKINEPEAPLEVTISKTRTTNFGSSTASATANPSGGTAGYSYEWRKYNDNNILGSLFASTRTINNQSAGLYQVTVIDNNGCKTVQDVKIIDKVRVEIIASSICDDVDNELRTSRFSVNLDSIAGGVGPVTNFDFEWDFGGGAIPSSTSGEGEIVVNYEYPGDKIITLTVTDNAEPRVTSSYTFNHYAGECFENCGQSMNFDIDRDSFYIGDSDGNPINSNNCSQNTNKFLWVNINKSSNVYALNTELVYTITNSDGNTVQKKAIDCFGTKVEVNNNKYEWELIPTGNFKLFRIQANSNFSTDIDWECGESFKIEGLSMRYVTNSKKDCGETNKNACIGLSEDVGVSTPIIASYNKENVLCFGESTGSIFINASGGIRPYQYSINGDNNTNYVTENRFFDLPAGIYSDVWVKDSKGNKYNLEDIEILQPNQGITGEPLPNNPTCFDEPGSAKIEPTGGTAFEDGTYEYLWNDPNNQTTQEATGLTAGNYTVTVIDANGCQIIREVEITQPEQLTEADAGPDQDFNCGFNATSLAANTPETGVGKWTILDGPSGGIIADDTIPNSDFTGNPGTYTLAWTISNEDETCPTSDEVQITFVEDCSSLDFDGEDDHVYLGDNYGFTSENFSIEAWIRPKSINNTKTIFSKRNTKDLSKGFDLIINSGAPTFRWGNKSVSTSHKVTANRWHHIAAIYNNGNISLYVDGIKVGNATATNPTALNAPALIGAMYNADTPDLPLNYFHGWIEEVRLWRTAISQEQLRFMMNQRLEVSQNPVRGDVLPIDVPGSLQWSNLKGYFQMKVTESGGGTTPNLGETGITGELRNIETSQENTAPLPYESEATGDWHNRSSWDPNSTKYWTFPNDKGIDNQTEINWNIAIQNHNLNSNSKDIKLLGLFNQAGKDLKMLGNNKQTGNELRITHYLKLDGFIDLSGESQLVQYEDSKLVGSGTIEKQQTGTASSYNYNYWSTPVMPNNITSKFTVAGILEKGLVNGSVKDIQFGNGPFYVEQNGDPNKINISNYWINGFFPNPQNPNEENANQYHSWKQLGSNPTKQDFKLFPGEGFTMKGTTNISVTDAEKDNIYQTYIFKGFPNNGTLELRKSYPNQNYLIGNPYPSAIDANEFIDHNEPYINGAIYYWHHFAGKSHYLAEYIGGYATYSKALGLPAKSIDSRIDNSNPNSSGGKRPGRFIPVAQGFFVNTSKNSDGPNASPAEGVIEFTNRMRVFAPDTDITGNSDETQFLKPETKTKEQAKYERDTRYKIRLNFNSPQGYWRQIGVAADGNTTQGIDYGYEALLIDKGAEDMYWMIDDGRFVIQGVPHFNLDQRLPLGITIAEEKEFSIEIGELENVPDIIDIYLRDNSDSTYYDLRKEAFKASLPAGEYQDLYEIVFHDVTSTRKDKEPGEGPIDYYYSLNNREFVISNPELHKIEHINIYNISGQLVDQHFGIPDLKEIHVRQKKSLSSAVYIVKVYTDSGDYAKKVIIRKD